MNKRQQHKFKNHIFKAIYENKYMGFFYLNDKKVQVSNYSKKDDNKVIDVENCLVYRWSGATERHGALLFENDIVINSKMDSLGVIIFKDCKFVIKHFDGKISSLSTSMAKRCELFGDVILDKDLFAKKPQSEPSDSKCRSPQVKQLTKLS